MGPFALNSQIDLYTIPYVRSAMYRGDIPSVHDHRNRGTEILQGRCCIFFQNILGRITNVQVFIMFRRGYFPL